MECVEELVGDNVSDGEEAEWLRGQTCKVGLDRQWRGGLKGSVGLEVVS